jgi:CRISPR/Cas system-associated exonuclease Cas4 (RecB family)
MKLTKTDFIHYLQCPESFWLAKKEPEKYPKGEFSLFLQKLIKEGYEVESYVDELFPDAIALTNFASPKETKLVLNQGDEFLQPSFITNKGVFARIDVLEKMPDNSWHLYEVKSSIRVSEKPSHNHIYDVCFQKYVLEKNGLSVSKCSIIHLNEDFIKNGTITAQDLLSITEVTDKVENAYTDIVNEIHGALTLLDKKPDLTQCSCLRKTRANHCETFEYFNRNLPQPNIYELKRLSEKKVNELVDDENFGLIDIPKGFDLSIGQQLQYDSFVQNAPIIERKAIRKTLGELAYPLHFFDYEAYGSAVPKLDGLKPFEQVPFQVSIHSMQIDGSVSHFEYLGDQLEFPKKMLEQMLAFTKMEGTFVSWYASYEMSANNRMISWLPEHEQYLDYINTHMFDLEKIFISDYVDYRFKGSSSIKKVLPILVPELSYKNLNVQDGTMAMDTWGKIVFDLISQEEKKLIRQDLLEYCKLDSLAMIKIFNYLKTL